MKKLVLLSLMLALVVLSFASTAGAIASPCPRQGIYCLDVWNPVVCSDGNVYSNSCYAYVACATGCHPLDT
ncbi:MAG TPA: hypothetical protein DD490_05295 [Acidobacteria bacterium]|nr:hypothetical protein [Acidobacteriota bacterium]